MGVRENVVEKYLDEQVKKKLGGITRKWTSPMRAGVPDRIVIFNSIVIFVEVKTESGELTSIQEREHERLKEHGAIVATVYGKEQVDKFITEVEAKCG